MWHNPDGTKIVSENLGFAARCLARAASVASLATQSGGQPFVSLVTPAFAADFAPLMLLSSLSEHTRQLRAEPRCALLLTGTPEGSNPQTAPRLTLTGLAVEVPTEQVPALKARWLARHPYAALYADFGDFSLLRLELGGALLVGGFARANRLKLRELVPEPAAAGAIAAAAEDIVGHVNADHADAVAVIATGLLGGPAGDWRMVSVDTDGADLASGETVMRLAFSAAVSAPEGVRLELMRAAREARSRGG
jgi:putative heme iron utilization protein